LSKQEKAFKMRINSLSQINYNQKPKLKINNVQNSIKLSKDTATFQGKGSKLEDLAIELYARESDLSSSKSILKKLKNAFIVFNRGKKIDANEKRISELNLEIAKLEKKFKRLGGDNKIKGEIITKWQDDVFDSLETES
jgi:TATA-box binding protein (TBP) (component of TFIID and TFIIIB)